VTSLAKNRAPNAFMCSAGRAVSTALSGYRVFLLGRRKAERFILMTTFEKWILIGIFSF